MAQRSTRGWTRRKIDRWPLVIYDSVRAATLRETTPFECAQQWRASSLSRLHSHAVSRAFLLKTRRLDVLIV